MLLLHHGYIFLQTPEEYGGAVLSAMDHVVELVNFELVSFGLNES